MSSVWRQETALSAHLGREKLLEDGPRFAPARNHDEAPLNDRDSRCRRDFDPDVPRTHRATPAIAALLTGDGHETEVAH